MSAAETNTTPPVVDLDALLAPIPGDNPAGESQQYTGLYDEIREARRSEDQLDQGDWKREPKVADWAETESLAAEALANRTKDLQVCAWLAEALVKLHGFAGLRDALRLTRGIIEQYWDGLYPEQDEGDFEGRANAITWLERQAAAALREVPLTGAAGYSFNDWETASAFNVGPDVAEEVAAERRQRAVEEGKITSEDWAKAKQTTPRAFYETTFALLGECWEAFSELDRAVDDHFGRQTPGMGDLKKMLDTLRTQVEIIVREKRLLEPDPADPGADEAVGGDDWAGAAPGGSAAAPAVAGPIKTRREAVARLAEAANFFRQTEPHSPVAYLVERAIKWSQMPLDAWLASVIKDGTVLDALRDTLGIEGESSSYEDTGENV